MPIINNTPINTLLLIGFLDFIYKSGNLELGDWPLQFIEIPIVNTTLIITSGEGSLYSTAGVTKSYCGKCNVWRTTSSALGCAINIIGIGRWK